MSIQPIGPFEAQIAIVGELPSEEDLRKGEPFSGGTGFEFRKMLQESGIPQNKCYMTLVSKHRVPLGRSEYFIAERKKDITSHHVQWQGKYVRQELVQYAEQLKEELLRVNPNVVVAMGNLSLFVLCGEMSITSWRSSIIESTLIPGLKVIPTYSPNMITRQWSLRPIMVHDLKRVKVNSLFPAIRRKQTDVLIRPSFEQAKGYLENLIEVAKGKLRLKEGIFELGADIETRAGHISCIAIAPSDAECICIPFMTVENPEGYWTAYEESVLVHLMYLLFTHSNVRIVGQNWNYDAQYIYRYWHFLAREVKDTMIQHHSCFSNLPKNLAFLSSMYLDDHYYWKDERLGWSDKDGGEEVYWKYNCTDAMRTLAIGTVLDSVVKDMQLESVNSFQQKLASKVLSAMNKGVRINEKRRLNFGLTLVEEFETRQKQLEYMINSPINIKSPLQLRDFFYRQMGLRAILDRKTGSPTTNDEALHRIGEREPILLPVTRKISELRSIGVFNSTFVQAPVDVDGRMRTSFNVCGTETYRLSSTQNAFGTGMNMQNIPKGGEDGELELPNIRTLFIPDEGKTMFDIDLDSADLRIVTWESDCGWMKDHFKNKRKPYVEIMREYYRDNTMTKDSHPNEYKIFKSLCHGTNYLGTAQGIAPRVGLLVHETERIQNWYFGMCPEIRVWQDEIKKQVSGRRFVQNAFGYRTYFLGRIEGNIFNEAVAWIPQSTVVCLINRGWVNIDDNCPQIDILLQVHDSLVGQFDTDKLEWAKEAILKETAVAIPYEDPLYIPVGIVTSEISWGDCG